jgi:flagellar motility protein MotE (MotC chaperone)
MKKILILKCISLSIFLGLLMNPGTVCAQALQQLQNMAGGSVYVPPVNGPARVGSSGSSGSSGSLGSAVSKTLSPSQSMSNMVAGAVMQGLINNLLSSPPEKSQAEIEAEKKEQERIAFEAEQKRLIEEARQQELHDELMKSTKTLDGSQSLDFKTLDGDMEKMRKAASNQFEPESTGSSSTSVNRGTDFFGTNVTQADIDLVTDPDNDPMIVDLRNAKNYIVKNIKTDSLKIQNLKLNDAKKAANPTKPVCNRVELDKKLNGFLTERQKFLKTIEMTQSELAKWEEQNNEALENTAKAGLEYFVGDLVGKLGKKGEAASRLENMLGKNAEQMAKEGLNVTEITLKIQRLRNLSSVANVVKSTYELKDWEAFIKDGWSALVLRVSESNAEIKEMLNDPQMQKYFTLENPSPGMNIPTPELKVLLDIANIGLTYDVFGTWVAKKSPVIALTQFSIDQIYNVTDWVLSYKRICDLREVSGKETEAANYQQQKINETISLIQNCQ